MEIWINPRCAKCRSALSILDAGNANHTVRRRRTDARKAADRSRPFATT